MKQVVLGAMLFALLMPDPAAADTRTRFFIGGGPTGTSDFGFQGGWGATLGLERRVGDAAALLVRAEGGALPSTFHYGGGPIIFFPLVGSLGESGPGSVDATLLSLMAGLRLRGSGRVMPYLDALVGIGYLNDPANTSPPAFPWPSSRRTGDHANIALSLGPGFAFHPPAGPGWFAEVHYDFLFVEGATTPVIPARFGIRLP